jgi:hypothetical protein
MEIDRDALGQVTCTRIQMQGKLEKRRKERIVNIPKPAMHKVHKELDDSVTFSASRP